MLLLSGGVLSAHAENDVYDNVRKQARGDDLLQVDTSYCSQMLGARRRTARRPREPTKAACSLAAGATITRCASARRETTCTPIRITPD
jgi:hypothetical protein